MQLAEKLDWKGLNGSCISGRACTFKLLPSKHTEINLNGILGHLLVHFSDQPVS